MKHKLACTLTALLLLTGLSVFAQAAPPITVSASLSLPAPYTAGQSATMTLTVTNTLPASVAALPLPITEQFTSASGATATDPLSSVLIPQKNDVYTNIKVSVTLPVAVLSITTVPTGMTYTAATGVLVLPTILSLDGGASAVYSVPITFLTAYQ